MAKLSPNIRKSFPFEGHQARINRYKYNEMLYNGQHKAAFNAQIDDDRYSKEYQQLRYITCNYAGLLSRVMADLLVGEAPKITVENNNQEFLENLLQSTNFNTLLHEQIITASSLGDAVFKMRTAENKLYIEPINPKIYYPQVHATAAHQQPDVVELAYKLSISKQEYVFIERHEKGRVTAGLYKYENEEITQKVDASTILPNLVEESATLTDFNWIIHVPNSRYIDRHYGTSDYNDIDSLLYALNNRMTKTDNILDKHSDPILMLPEGILDKDGNVKRRNLQMFEKPAGSEDKPEYIVWNASLENQIKQIDKLVEFLFMISEVSPDVLGMGQGQADSGRAIKYKMLRTLAKVRRKRLYFDTAIKDLLYKAQIIAKVHNIEIDGAKVTDEPKPPAIEWYDGIPDDELEVVEVESMKLAEGLTTETDAIMRIHGIDKDQAEEKQKQIAKNRPPAPAINLARPQNE